MNLWGWSARIYWSILMETCVYSHTGTHRKQVWNIYPTVRLNMVHPLSDSPDRYFYSFQILNLTHFTVLYKCGSFAGIIKLFVDRFFYINTSKQLSITSCVLFVNICRGSQNLRTLSSCYFAPFNLHSLPISIFFWVPSFLHCQIRPLNPNRVIRGKHVSIFDVFPYKEWLINK